LHCRCCARPVQRDEPESIAQQLAIRTQELSDRRLVITFPITVPANFTEDEVRGFLDEQGYSRVHREETRDRPVEVPAPGRTSRAEEVPPQSRRGLCVIEPRLRYGSGEFSRVMGALDARPKQGDGHIAIHALNPDGGDAAAWRFTTRLPCAQCAIEYSTP